MKKFITLALIVLTINGYSQILEPVKWTTKNSKISANEYEITLTAHIDNGWYIYSQNITNNGPTPTVFTFDKSNDYDIIGNVAEGKGKEYYDKVFKMQVKKIDGNAIFKQRIRKNTNSKILVIGLIEFQTCSSEQCIQDSYDIEVEI